VRLICAITGDVTKIPNAWTAWRIGPLYFRREGDQVQWREMGSMKWHTLPAIDRRRERVERPRRSA
jgi:hypothetical protein